MTFSWENWLRPILALAPMAGYTDSAYRQLIKGLSKKTVCFTEFTSADGIVFASKGSLRQLDFNPEEERPLVAQIFGKNPEHFRKAAKKLEEMGVDAIDINMGCPAKKVVSSDHGSALLKNPCRALEIVEATVQGSKLPVSVKMRLGTDHVDLPWLINFCKNLESVGVKLLTIHGRTAKQLYTGFADWEPIYEVKRHVGIPVIGNGDIRSKEDALKKLKHLDGVMVGRGTMGNPWLMAEIEAAFYGGNYTPPRNLAEKLPALLRHAELNVQTKGEQRGIMEMRKHFVHLLRGFEGASELRSRSVQVSNLEETKAFFREVEKALKENPSFEEK